MHTPNTSSFQRPKAHYIQLEDLQGKDLEKKKKTKTSEAQHIWQQSWHRHVFRLMNSKASAQGHDCRHTPTTNTQPHRGPGGSPTTLLPLGKSLEPTGKTKPTQKENVGCGPQKKSWTLEGRIAP
jgi:hypothetical protein